MKRFICWLRHRRYWTVLADHPIPFLADRWCPLCSRPPFHQERLGYLLFDAGLVAA